MKKTRIILGLVASGKTTLYRKLNEEKICNAVEIELPQSCFHDENMKKTLMDLYLNSESIDCIIVHPYFLPKDFEYDFEYLNVPIDERKRRAIKRSVLMDSDCIIFNGDFFEREEEALQAIKNKKEFIKW